MSSIIGFDIESDELIGHEGGFLGLRRLRMRNRRADGSRSEPYQCDYVVRPTGLDAVVVAVYHLSPEAGLRVLVRDELRPPLMLARSGEGLPVPEERTSLLFTGVVAGILEAEDRGEEGIRSRAAIEVWEEAGYRVCADDVVFLGAGTFPTPGAIPEKFWLTAVPIADPEAREPPPGDGSPMEEGATIRWLDVDQAIAACVRGEIADAKTELVLRRLRDRLADPRQGGA
jgi:ADP-ribose pyrophosphatase